MDLNTHHVAVTHSRGRENRLFNEWTWIPTTWQWPTHEEEITGCLMNGPEHPPRGSDPLTRKRKQAVSSKVPKDPKPTTLQSPPRTEDEPIVLKKEKKKKVKKVKKKQRKTEKGGQRISAGRCCCSARCSNFSYPSLLLPFPVRNSVCGLSCHSYSAIIW